MAKNIKSHIKPDRSTRPLADLVRELKTARLRRGWTQEKLGQQTGLPQMHISGIERGKIVPRYDTLLELIRVLELDLIVVPRSLVPAVLTLIRDYKRRDERRFQNRNSMDEDEGPFSLEDGLQQGKGAYREEI